MRKPGQAWDNWVYIQEVLEEYPHSRSMLTDRQKQIVDCIRRDGKASLDEIGCQLGISREAIRQQLHQLRLRLKKYQTTGISWSYSRDLAIQKRFALLQTLDLHPQLLDGLTELQRRAIAALKEQPVATEEELGKAMGSTGSAWKSRFKGAMRYVERCLGSLLGC